MTRPIDLQGQTRISAAIALDEADRLVMRARRAQSRYMAEMIRQGATALSRATGLSALAEALRRHAVYRRTLDELGQLDNAMLADIGLTRSEIRRRALECSRESVPARARWWNRLGAWLERARDEHRTVRELSALDARMLRDIGIEPGSLRGAAERMASPNGPIVVEAVTALREAVVVLFTPFREARQANAAATLGAGEPSDGKRAA